MSKVIDVCTFNNEADLWDIHYNVLKDHVDQFIVVEFDQTFSGKPKELAFPTDRYPEVTYRSFSEKDWEKYRDLAESSPNTQGAEHWKLEFMQKECIKDALGHLKDEDIVFIGDVDEVWDPMHSMLLYEGEPKKLNLLVYTYYLNNHSSEQFSGTLVGTWKLIKRHCLNHLRTEAWKPALVMGWHFTSMGGPEALKKKLTDSYTQESYATPEILENVAYNIENKRDFLGRSFTYTIDESQWPQHLKEHKEKYVHLLALDTL